MGSYAHGSIKVIDIGHDLMQIAMSWNSFHSKQKQSEAFIVLGYLEHMRLISVQEEGKIAT